MAWRGVGSRDHFIFHSPFVISHHSSFVICLSSLIQRLPRGAPDFGEDEVEFRGLLPESAGVGFLIGAGAGDHAEEETGFAGFLS